MLYVCYEKKHKEQKIGPQKSHPKGQLISKGLFKDFICTKKRTNIFLYFCPSL